MWLRKDALHDESVAIWREGYAINIYPDALVRSATPGRGQYPIFPNKAISVAGSESGPIWCNGHR